MDSRRRSAAGARCAVALTLAAALAACGSPGEPGATPSTAATGASATATATASLDPTQLLRQAVRNMVDAPSKRLRGTASVSITSLEFDVVYVGDDAKGTHISRAMGLESVVQFVKVDYRLYILADEGYWQSYVRLEQLHQVVDRWVLVSAGNPNHTSLLVLGGEGTRWDEVGSPTMVGPGSIDGVPVVVLRNDDDQRFSISAEDPPYLLRFEGTVSIESRVAQIEMTFSDFGTVTETITPPTGDVLDIR